MLAAGQQTGNDHYRVVGIHHIELLNELITIHAGIRRSIEVTITDSYTCTGVITKPGYLIRLAVAIGVHQAVNALAIL